MYIQHVFLLTLKQIVSRVLLLLLLLSCFSCVRLCATPWTAAYHAPPSMGFSDKSTGVGCHCLLRSRVLDIPKQRLYSELHIQVCHQANKNMKQTL